MASRKSQVMSMALISIYNQALLMVVTASGRIIMRSDVSIHYDGEGAKYAAGDVIKGHVEVVLTSEIKVKEIIANFFGIARVCWSEQRAYTKGSSPVVNHKNSEVYLDQNVVLLMKDTAKEPLTKRDSNRAMKASRTSSKNSTLQTPIAVSGTADEEGILISAGSHIFPFELTLPRDLPASYVGQFGQVKYGVHAMLVRPWKFDIEREREFEVTGYMDMNEEPDLAVCSSVRPIGGLEEFRIGFMCFEAGRVTAELRVARRGYIPGEMIPFSAEIENLTSKTLHETRVALVQIVIFRIGKKSKRSVTTLSSMSKGAVQAGSTFKMQNESLPIPPVPPSSSKSCKVLSIRYAVQLCINHSSWQENLILPVTVTIGTIGLRVHTINTYLQLLGIAPTPMSSPRTSERAMRQSISSADSIRRIQGSRQSIASNTTPRLQDSKRRKNYHPLPSAASKNSLNTDRDSLRRDTLENITEMSDSPSRTCSVEVYASDNK
ncbi:hypothetical protein CAPTEDRAFT_212962 [Capitella teleta]|uniref:Arrestin C-terminal-like domain-containing protein n=1 Tax=Capitella teleta TaxID=283909 RepID=R7U9J7_CAPTE|nr:hypothetical protein CAPTEDRAFT_212962 [Capitella teleta]|eukprot:ELU02816.1 hypothetical protein CAPTEDRAFT_212962 [Capitella teleta]